MLKEAEWVYGVVVSVGTQTKANFTETGEGIMPVLKACCLAEQTKTPSVNGVINPQIMILSLVLVILCLGGAAGYAIIHLDALKNAFYLDLTPEDTEDADKQTSIWLQTIAIFFTYFLLNYQFIPISLYVTLKGVRTLQSRFMVKDPKMYDALDDEPMQVCVCVCVCVYVCVCVCAHNAHCVYVLTRGASLPPLAPRRSAQWSSTTSLAKSHTSSPTRRGR